MFLLQSEKERQLQDDKIRTLRVYYDQVKHDYERHVADFDRTGSASARAARDSNEALLRKLESQLQSLTSGGATAAQQALNNAAAVSQWGHTLGSWSYVYSWGHTCTLKVKQA